MSLDPYQPCPCGSEKKLKFCCGAEVSHELEKIQLAMEGEQRLAALDHINKLLATHPKLPSALMYKAIVELSLGELEPARQSATKLLEVAPTNPAGLALSAILACQDGQVLEAIGLVQQALEQHPGKIHHLVYQAIGTLGRALFAAGEVLAARGHLTYQVRASQGKDENAFSAMMDLDSSGQVPLVAHTFVDVVPPPAEGALSAAGQAEFQAALKDAAFGCFQAAAKKFEALAASEPTEPTIWRNLGTLLVTLAEDDIAAAIFQKYAAFAAVPRDEAIEAEALAQFLAMNREEYQVPEITATFTIEDASTLREAWLSNKQFQAINLRPEEMDLAEGEPPPQNAFFLLDRPVPATGVDIARDAIPRVLGEILFYGRQTDRAARVEFTAPQLDDWAERIATVRALIGNHLQGEPVEEPVGLMNRNAAILAVNWRFPDDTPPEQRTQLILDQRRHLLLEVFPDAPQASLDGASLRQAAADPALQNKALATILLMDLAQPQEEPVFNDLRRSLGLPTVDDLDPSGRKLQSLSLAQLTRVDPTKLSDEDVMQAFTRGTIVSCRRLVLKMGREVIERPSLDKVANKEDVFEILSRQSADPVETLDLLTKAQEWATARGRSPARFILQEIPLRLLRGEQAEFTRIMETLRAKHMNEPGIAQGLYMMLAQLGLIRPQGGAMPPGAGGPGAGMGGPGMGAAAMPAAAPAASGGLWTPGQAAAPAADAGKSKLWLPGME
jgi:tetratricopeptide (TPR) repeat protein